MEEIKQMDLQKTAKEIGLFELASNLSKVRTDSDIIQKVGASMPLPDENISAKIGIIAEWILSFNKSKYLFLTPEIALIEEIKKKSCHQIEIIIAVPCDLDSDAKNRLSNNLPKGMPVSVLEEPYFPQSFFPSNGMIVCCGYLANNRLMVLPDTYRMAEHYSGFLGKKVFIPYKELETATRCENWIEIKSQQFDMIWKET